MAISAARMGALVGPYWATPPCILKRHLLAAIADVLRPRDDVVVLLDEIYADVQLLGINDGKYDPVRPAMPTPHIARLTPPLPVT